nr:uncharacterized protein LOC129051278 isoform X2 [Pongo abelii]
MGALWFSQHLHHLQPRAPVVRLRFLPIKWRCAGVAAFAEAHVQSAVNRRHFSAPQKLHADCEKEMLDGGVPGTTVREMVRELWMWNVEEEHEVRICTWDAQHCGCPTLRMPGKGTARSTSRRGLCASVGIAADGETFGVAEECPQTLEGIRCILHGSVCLPRAIFSGSGKSRWWARAGWLEPLGRRSPGGGSGGPGVASGCE